MFRLGILLVVLLLSACTSSVNYFVVHCDGYSQVKIESRDSLLILPIEESAPLSHIEYLAKDGQIILDVHLARERVDYYVPLTLSQTKVVKINHNMSPAAVVWDSLYLSNEFVVAKDKFRPSYHFTPTYGWMNDPNGLVYKNGEYHLFYQYNPYGSVWGNMHWGHAVSDDLIDWEHLPIAIYPDDNGAAFSGSTVVDVDNVSGLGEDAIIAFYTSNGETQTQSIAYSTDNGRTFAKYDSNPILRSTERDFRDPKVIYHNNTERYIMAIAAGQNIEFYSSADLLNWRYESKFGEGYGMHSDELGVWECPDLIEIDVENSSEKRWVLLVNINSNGPAGGSATQYFIGDFDGRSFRCEDEKHEVKWMDYGIDHYAAVTWSNVPDGRILAIAWMNNWIYANNVPTKWFRSSNSIVRELSLFQYKDELYLASSPIQELKTKRVETNQISEACEICFTLQPFADNATFSLANEEGERVDFRVDFINRNIAIDRRESGDNHFSNNFATVTTAPIFGNDYQFRIYVDRSSVECFVNNGKSVLTNTLYPTSPYNQIEFAQNTKVKNMKIYNIDRGLN